VLAATVVGALVGASPLVVDGLVVPEEPVVATGPVEVEPAADVATRGMALRPVGRPPLAGAVAE
jgi:hypothetical protein